MKQYVNIPNCITLSRIIGAILLFFVKPFSLAFYVIYTICGITDAIDGFVARLTKKSSEFGAKLDSVSDIVFYFALLLKIFPFLLENLEMYIWYITIGAIVIRICSYITAVIKYKRFASLHTYGNKITGLLLFCVPYFFKWFNVIKVCVVVSTVACLASLEEFLIHITSKEYRERKSIFVSGKKA